MGSFFTNVHIRTDDDNGVAEAAAAYGSAYLTDSSNGWISLYPEATESQDYDSLIAVAVHMSKLFKCAAIGMLCHDSDIFQYILCENGKVVDQYNSAPGYFEGADFEPSGGNVDALLRVTTNSEATREMFLDTLHQEVTFAEDTVSEFAELMGIDAERALVGFTYAEQGEADFDIRPIGAGGGAGGGGARNNVVQMHRPQAMPAPETTATATAELGPIPYSPNVVPQVALMADGKLRMGWRVTAAPPAMIERAREFLQQHAEKIEIEQLNWSPFVTKRLLKAEVKTLAQVTAQTRDSLMAMGKMLPGEFADEVAAELAKFGMTLKG